MSGNQKSENRIIDEAAGFVSSAVVDALCDKYVVHMPKSREDIRKFLKTDYVMNKMIFPKKFDSDTTEALHNVVQVCPITMGFPRFPMRDKRLNSNGLPKGHIYDWAGLQLVLSQPKGKRSCDSLNYASEENFELCEDLCSQIHHILFARGEISSADPVESIVYEINLTKQSRI